jgi:hypothetical protein
VSIGLGLPLVKVRVRVRVRVTVRLGSVDYLFVHTHSLSEVTFVNWWGDQFSLPLRTCCHFVRSRLARGSSSL